MKKYNLIFGLCFTGLSFANNDIMMDGEVMHSISPENSQMVKLIHYKFSPTASLKIKSRLAQASSIQAKIQHPAAYQLGMNNVPVLNQGSHGSCVTFAVSALIDAVIGKGDYVSQVCSLALGQYLEQHAYQLSGWNGSTASTVLQQFINFGYINKKIEKTTGCAGLKDYPLLGDEPKNEMSIENYHLYSQNLEDASYIYPSTIMDPYQFIYQPPPANSSLNAVKSAILHKNRVLIGVLLPLDDVLGAWGSYHAKNDTWVLTEQLKQSNFINHLDNFAGHELIITGFDDNVIIEDAFGQKHQGAFTLRNSWGSNSGDHGNYYMSYDYFNTLAWELTRIFSFE